LLERAETEMRFALANGMFKQKWTSIATVPDLCPTTVKILIHLISRYQLPFNNHSMIANCSLIATDHVYFVSHQLSVPLTRVINIQLRISLRIFVKNEMALFFSIKLMEQYLSSSLITNCNPTAKKDKNSVEH
jgi:hypothetical protein